MAHAVSASYQRSEQMSPQGMALAFLTVVGGIAFYTSVWQPHRAAMAQALERTLPDALRAQSQEVAALGRRLDAGTPERRDGRRVVVGVMWPVMTTPASRRVRQLHRKLDDVLAVAPNLFMAMS